MLPGFDVRYDTTPIMDVSIPVHSKLRYNAQLDHNFAAQWWHIDLESFRALPAETQEEMIATYRLRHRIDAVVAHKQMQKQQAIQQQPRKPRKR